VVYSLGFDANRGRHHATWVVVLHRSAAAELSTPHLSVALTHRPAPSKRQRGVMGVRELFVDALAPWIPTQLDLLEADGDLYQAAVDSGVLWQHLQSLQRAEMV
jgi:hypothetical protein